MLAPVASAVPLILLYPAAGTRRVRLEVPGYDDGIRVNALCPGFFPSKMSGGLLNEIGPKVIERTPLGRLGGDTDLMGAAVFLASEASRHVTGQYICVDGGASLA
jgi:NAD(P)-dependent dehydrogenase (short-subunit alcohol dehydrogenase family)